MTKYTKAKLGDICRIEKGRTGIASAVPGEYPLVVTAEERKTCSEYQFDCEAVCIPLVSSSGHGKKSLKNVHYQSGKFALGSILCAVIPNNPKKVNARYLHQYLQFYKDTLLVPLMKGAANVSLSMRDIANVEVPLPDFDTQAALAKTFVEAQEKQKQLNAEFENQTEYAKRLRQNILQKAIEGKLTAEWRKQNPFVKGNPDFDVQALFEQIQKEKKYDKKQKNLVPITDEEIPFEIPAGWKWVRLGEICNSITDGDHQAPPKCKTGIPFLVISDVSSGKIDFKGNRFVSEIYFKNLPKERVPEKNSILYTVTGSYGIPIIVSDFRFCVQRHISIIKLTMSEEMKKFVFYILQSLHCKKQADSVAWGVAVKTVPINALRNFSIPLPSLAEQKEIVAKVESLLLKVSELEKQIQERKRLSGLLMQTALKNAFAPQE